MTLYSHSTVYTGDDVRINGVTLNTISDDGCRWILTGLDGWWGLPTVEIPEDTRPFSEEGSYMTRGRYGVRNIVMTGYIVPSAENTLGVPFTVAARNTLNRALHLVRQTGLLEVDELDETKSASVQTVGRPLTKFNGLNDVLEFNVQLIASDPRKYATVSDTVSVSLPVSGAGRKYYRTYNWAYFIPGDPSQINAYNRGSYDTGGVAVITGPVLNPTLEHLGQGITLGFNVSIGLGETLTLDFAQRTATLSSGLSVKNRLMLNTDWFTLEPGDNYIRFGGTQTIAPQSFSPAAVNYVTNPSFETASGTLTLATNLVTNPAFETNTTGWVSAGSVTSFTRTQDNTNPPLPGRTWFGRIVTSNAAAAAINGSTTWTVVAGEVFHAEFRVRGTPGESVALRITWTGAGTTQSSATILASTTAWQLVQFDSVVPASATAARVDLLRGSGASVVTIDMSCAQFLRNYSRMPVGYFDGGFQQVPDTDLTSAWTGTASNSTSTLSAPAVVGVATAFPERARPYQSSQWSLTGTKSLRVTAMTSDSYGEVALTGLTIGNTYTVVYQQRSTALLSGATNATYAGRFSIVSPAPASQTMITTASNAVGQQEIRGTFVAASTTHSLRLGVGYAVGELWFENLIVTDGTYFNSYFDGSFPYAVWSGAADASTSTRPELAQVNLAMVQLTYTSAWIE